MFTLRPYQKEASDAGVKHLLGRSKKPGVIVAPTGCHGKGELISMADGTKKKVEDICVGDRLIGNDGTNRTVIELHRGVDDMYKIIPIKGNPFVVNGDHIMSLYKTNEGDSPSERPRIDHITVKDYINTNKNYKHLHKLYKPDIVNYDKNDREIILDPYFIGIYLGDGSSSNGSISITTMREEIVEYLYELVKEYNLYIRVSEKKGTNNKAKSYFLSGEKCKGCNIIINELIRFGIFKCTAKYKFIPLVYLASSKENRLKLLAGFLDTDSYYDGSKNTYEYCSKSFVLVDQIVTLCRSLGLYAMIGKPKIVNGETYYRISITGDLENVPTKVGIRKGRERKQKKNNRVTGFSVEYIGKGEYFGFEVDGNHLYCDGQLFVHHNSGKSVIIGDIVKRLNAPTLILQPSKEILEQNYNKAISFGMSPTIYSASCGVKELSELTFATLKSVKKDVERLKQIGIKFLLIDEAHASYSAEEGSEFMKFMKELGDVKTLGFTATPCKLHTYSSMVEGNYSKLNILTKDDPRYFQKIVHVTQIKELVDEGFWSKLKYERWEFDNSALVLNSTGAEYTANSISATIVKIGLNNTIYKRIMQLLNERKHILVAMDSVENCNRISEFMNARMGNITAVVSNETSKKKRENIIEDFKSGKIRVVFNYSALSTGFDFPELDCVILGRPTFSFAYFYQVLGRAVRPHPSKEDALIVDCCDNYSRFGRIEDLSIEEFPGRGWCMFSEDKLISGIPMGHTVMRAELVQQAREKGLLVPAVNEDGRRSHPLDSQIMWFGKYEGIMFKNIPLNYFKFIVENFDVNSEKIKMIVKYYKEIIL